jgi:polar amino acid transport system substrate-binding protein
MSRRSLAVLWIGVALAASLSACSTPEDAAETASTPAACDLENVPTLTAGKLTIGTGEPASPPYFEGDDPTNGKGFESAFAYAVAEELGFAPEQVTWVRVPFSTTDAPGEKRFDFGINQISITPEREEVVSFSAPYYIAPYALVALEGSSTAEVTKFDEVRDSKVGVLADTTSLEFVDSAIGPTTKVQVYDDTAAAAAALKNGQIDAIVADLPTASLITEDELDNGIIVGKFYETEASEWGLLLAKDSELLGCVNQAIATLEDNGTLESLQEDWLPFLDVPKIK